VKADETPLLPQFERLGQVRAVRGPVEHSQQNPEGQQQQRRAQSLGRKTAASPPVMASRTPSHKGALLQDITDCP